MEDVMSDRRWSRDRLPKNWVLPVIGLPGGVAVWSGWVNLGVMCGFGDTYPLPGLAPHFKIDTTFTLPVGMEAYAVYAMGAALGSVGTTPESRRAREFAKWSMIGALLAGMIAQVAYHLLAASHKTRAPVLVVGFVACLPVVTIALAAWLSHLKHAASKAESDLAEQQTRDQDKQAEREKSERDETERSREHERAMERLRLEADERARLAELAAAQQRREDRDRDRHDRDVRLRQAAERHGLAYEQKLAITAGPSSTNVTDSVTDGRPALRVAPPPEARAKSRERQLMWATWVDAIHGVDGQQPRILSGEELRAAGGCNEGSAAGRIAAREWKGIEPARSFLASQRERAI
jgi:hypothetical protein